MRALPILIVLALVGCKKAPVEQASKPPSEAAAVAPTEAAPAAEEEEAPPPPPPKKVDPDKDLRAAVALLDRNTEADTIKARTELRAITSSRPDAALAWYNLGVAYARLGSLVDAADAFQRATRVDADLAAAWRGLGEAELQLGDVDTALRRLDRALQIDPDDTDARVARIRALRQSGRSAQAIEEAKAALKVNSLALGVYNLMGLAYLDIGEPERARFVYEKAETVEGAEDDARIQANFGWTLKILGEPYAAEIRLKRAVELDPEFVPGLVYLAQLYLADRNFGDMVPLLEKALKKAPENHGVLVDLGIAYRGLGRLDEAQRSWEKALDLKPADPVPLFNLGILLGDDRKDYDGAVRYFNRYIEAGGPESTLALEYIEDIEREKKKAERQRERDEARRKREEDRAKREKLLKEAEKEEQGSGAPASGGSPWDTQGGGGMP